MQCLLFAFLTNSLQSALRPLLILTGILAAALLDKSAVRLAGLLDPAGRERPLRRSIGEGLPAVYVFFVAEHLLLSLPMCQNHVHHLKLRRIDVVLLAQLIAALAQYRHPCQTHLHSQ